MKKNSTFIIIAFLSISFCTIAEAQVHNRLPRKAIIGAMQNAMQDSTGSNLKPFVCKKGTKSITIKVTNASLPEERPYIITADSLGITLEIFRGNEHVYNEFFQYHGSNFAKIKAKANSAKLKKVAEQGVLLAGGNTTVLSFNNAKGPYFSLTENSGLRDYAGDFDGVITEIIRQIPNFQAIICKDYNNEAETITSTVGTSTPILKDNEIKINDVVVELDSISEVTKVLACDIAEAFSVGTEFEVQWPSKFMGQYKLIKLRKFKNKKKKQEFYGFTYEDIVKNNISSASETTGSTVVAKYSIENPANDFVYYILYNDKTGKGVVLMLSKSDVVG